MSLLCVSQIIFAAVLFRTSDGKLHLLPEIGKIPFVDATLIEDPTETSSCDDDDGMVLCTSFFQNQFEIWNIERTTKLRFVFNYWYSLNRSESLCSTSSQTSSEMSDSSATADRSSRQHSGTNYHGLDFQLIVENKSGNGPGKVVHLVAPSMQDKAAWISDISQVVFCFCFFKKCIQQFEMIWFFFFFLICFSFLFLLFLLFFFLIWRPVYRQRAFQRLCPQFHLGRFVRDSSTLGAQRSASLQRRHRHSIQPHPQLVQSQSPRAVGSVVKQYKTNT